MKRVAFIPVRGGSQGIPGKNIKLLAGKPLIHWTMEAAEKCPQIDEVVIATDSDAIEKVARQFQGQKVKIYRREAVNAQNTSSTESVMLEYLGKANLQPEDLFILIQATNPFVRAEHLADAIHLLESHNLDSLLSAVRTKRFFWNASGEPLNYDYNNRPRRQDFEGLFMENGAFYINSVENILKFKNRLSGKVGVYEMPEASGFEIDEPEDWIIVESLLQRQQQTSH
jgi:N-acylneuraminate cytidylyltransferase